jgi:polar amino acid transport system substrate-binding protein
MKRSTLVAAVAAGAALAVCLGLAACSSSTSSSQTSSTDSTTTSTSSGYTLITPGELTIGASLDFPPFESLNATTGTAEGFSVDLMEAICDEMGLKCNYLSSIKFDALIPALVSGTRMDVSVSSFTITEDRKDEVDFTDAYFDSNQSIVVMQDSGITDVSQLQGKKIAAQSGTTGYDWAVENISGADVVAFDEVTAVFAALQSGQVDAVSIDLPVATDMIKNGYSDATIIKETPTGEQYGIAVNKNNPGLTEALNEALATLKANGTYEQIYDKWFSLD